MELYHDDYWNIFVHWNDFYKDLGTTRTLTVIGRIVIPLLLNDIRLYARHQFSGSDCYDLSFIPVCNLRLDHKHSYIQCDHKPSRDCVQCDATCLCLTISYLYHRPKYFEYLYHLSRAEPEVVIHANHFSCNMQCIYNV